MTALAHLIEALEKATGPSRELDAEIWMTLHPEWRDYPRADTEELVKWQTPKDGLVYLEHAYTESIDAALTLYEDESDGLYALGDAIAVVFSDFDIAPTTTDWKFHVLKRLIITALRARQEEGS